MRKTLTVLIVALAATSLAACKMFWDKEPATAAVTPAAPESTETAQTPMSPATPAVAPTETAGATPPAAPPESAKVPSKPAAK